MKALHYTLGVVIVLILLAVPLVVIAEHGPCEDDEEMRAEMRQQMEEHQQQVAEDLNLTAEQTRLWNAFHEAEHNFFESQRDDMDNASHAERMQHRRYMHRVHRIFYHEMMAEQPDFVGAAEQIKKDYQGTDAAAFNVMIDASTSFHQSLTSAQREQMLELMESRPPHGPGFHRH